MMVGQIARLKRREWLGQTARKLFAEGVRPADIARELGISKPEATRLLREDPMARRTRAERRGRPVAFELSPVEKSSLRREVLKTESVNLAIERFARHPECGPETRGKILSILDRAAERRRSPNWPLSLRRAAYVTAEERAMFRGPKHFQEVEMVQRRDMTIELEDGSRAPLGPNMLWESDDMSSNEPFSFHDPETGQPRLGRQTLFTLDVFSSAWLGCSPVGRSRDAYRAEDIADHLWDVVREHGLPLVWRLERGAWENQMIDGIELRRPAPQARWGGLNGLIHIRRAFTSRGKGTVESAFDLLQSLIAHESTSIGRRRGEFERGTKLMLKAGRGNARAAAEFWDISEYADDMVRAMREFNARPKQRRAFGREMVAPEDLYRPSERRECPREEAWRFLPVKREATVRGGHLEMSVAHYPMPFRFRVNGELEGLYLERGYRVLAAFHPGRPEEGCHVFNAEGGARNREGMRFGELIGLAPLSEDAPQVSLARHEKEAFSARKRANAAVRTSFRSIQGAGRKERGSDTARDGFGESARVEISRGGERSEGTGRRSGGDAGPNTRDPALRDGTGACAPRDPLMDLILQDEE